MTSTRKDPEIQKIMTISTGHLTADTRERLAEESKTNQLGLTLYDKSEYGWYIYINDASLQIAQQDFPDLYTCMHFAKAHNCSILCFDRDAEPVAGLTYYPNDDSDKGEILYIYTGCCAEPCGTSTVYSRHLILYGVEETQAVKLIEDDKYRNVLTRTWYDGDQKLRQHYDRNRNIWYDSPLPETKM